VNSVLTTEKDTFNMTKPRVLITGATGILGSWVLAEALWRGWRPVVLMRDASLEKARGRLAAVLRLVGEDASIDAIDVVHGDTRQPLLGIAPEEAPALRSGLAAVIHCAACTSFSDTDDREVMETNVGGVRNVLAFLEGSGVPLFHVSTAYVAGDRLGLVRETELEAGQGFHNAYERSKYLAEQQLHASMQAGALQASIFRPAIIIGASRHGRITQFLNFYCFLRLVDWALSRRWAPATERIRMMASAEATKNLVPVDWAARALWTILERTGATGTTYHLTNPRPVSQASLLEWANAQLGRRSLQLEFVDELNGDATRFEAAVRNTFKHYRTYLQREPLFDRTQTDAALAGGVPFPEVGPELYARLVHFARAQKWRGIFGCMPEPIEMVRDTAAAGPARALALRTDVA
jgi:thioester reductase-like protein